MSGRGRPFEKGNKAGRGRPRGSRNQSTLMAQELLSTHTPALMRKCIAMALGGDTTALRLCLERAVPVRRDLPLSVGKLPVTTAAELAQSSEAILTKVSKGDITVAEGLGLGNLLEAHRKVIETQDLEQRLANLERQRWETHDEPQHDSPN